MLSPLQNYFHHSRGERRGTFVLVSIIFILVSFYFLRDTAFPVATDSADAEAFEAKIAQFEAQKEVEIIAKEIIYFTFNPNHIGVIEWEKLGFTSKQAEAIENYKASGAVFEIKKDLMKLFMVDEQVYQQLEPYIDLPDAYPESHEEINVPKKVYGILLATSDQPIYQGFEDLSEVHYSKKEGKYQYWILSFETEAAATAQLQEMDFPMATVQGLYSTKGFYPIAPANTAPLPKSKNEVHKLSIDLNLADTTELKQLYGIGSSYASRIVNYRNALGGFISLTQLNEVYGLQEETVSQIVTHLYLSEQGVQRIDINGASIEDLKAHPYIDWKVANSIVQIRNNYGKFASVDGIKVSKLIDEALFQKLEPYLIAK
jgi:DNA uptake protein ComE-like DNA-binding protein